MVGQRKEPAAILTLNPLYRQVGRPHGRFARMGKTSPPPAIYSADRPARSEALYRLTSRYTGSPVGPISN